MKRSFIFVASALVIALASCTEVLPEKAVSNSGMNKIVFGMASETVTKTALLDEYGKADPDGATPYWKKGDEIELLGNSYPKEVVEIMPEDMDGKQVYVCETRFGGADSFYGVYPVTSYPSLSGSTITMTIPSEQTGKFEDAHFCAAQSYFNDSNPDYVRTYHLDFYPVAPILHFKKSDFQNYEKGWKLVVTGSFTENTYYPVGATTPNEDPKSSSIKIGGSISVEFNLDGTVKSSTPNTTYTKPYYSISTVIDNNTLDDIYLAVWPGISTTNIRFEYFNGVASQNASYVSYPVQEVVLECNKIYPAFFGRRVTDIDNLNYFLNNVTDGNAHYLITRPNGSGRNITFCTKNINNMLGLDFSNDIEYDQTYTFGVSPGVDDGPASLILVAPTGKNTTFVFDEVLRENTDITVNGNPVENESYTF